MRTVLKDFLAIPLRPDSKLPIPGISFATSRAPARAFAAKGQNHGLLMAANGLVIVDVDMKGGRNGYAELKALGPEYNLPKTFAVTSPSGGMHLYYCYDREAVPRVHGSNLKLTQTVDIKLGQGYVVSPLTNPKYKQYLPSGKVIARAPAWLLAILEARQGKEEAASAYTSASGSGPLPTALSPVSADALLTFKEYVASFPEALEGERNTRALFLACRLLEAGLDADTAYLVLRDNFRSVPGMPEDELLAVVRNAGKYCRFEPVRMDSLEAEYQTYLSGLSAEEEYRAIFGNPEDCEEGVYAGSDAGCGYDETGRTDEADLTGVPLSLASTPSASSCFTLSALLGSEPFERRWLVSRWLPANELSILYGDGGSGKSLIAAQLAYALATGTDWLGLPVPEGKKRPVLYVACEDAASELQRRFRAVCNGHDRDSISLHVWPWRGHDTYLCEPDPRTKRLRHTSAFTALKEHIEELHAWYSTTLGADYGGIVIILDTLANFFGGDELSRAQVQTFINRIIGRLCQDRDSTLNSTTEYAHSAVLLAHTNKSGQYSGSTAWNNSVAARLSLAKKPVAAGKTGEADACQTAPNGAPIMALTQEKSNYGPSGQEQLIHFDSGVFIVSDPEEQDTANEQTLLAHVAALDKAETPLAWPLKRNAPLPAKMSFEDVRGAIVNMVNTEILFLHPNPMDKKIKCVRTHARTDN